MVLIAAILCMTFSLLFLVLYAFIIDIKNPVAANIWMGVLTIAFLAFAGIVVETHSTDAAQEIAIFGYGLGIFVAIWRTVLMIKFANAAKKERDKK